MKPNIKHSTNELLKYINLDLDGIAYRELCEGYQLDLEETTFQMYIRKFLKHGMKDLLKTQRNRNYSSVFKHRLIQGYLHSIKSCRYLVVKYNIPSNHTTRNWVMRYTVTLKDKLHRF